MDFQSISDPMEFSEIEIQLINEAGDILSPKVLTKNNENMVIDLSNMALGKYRFKILGNSNSIKEIKIN